MKVAITGHTSGIGKSMAQLFEKYGHEVVGFSRSTGYDISKTEDRLRIIAQIQDCEVFINNAYSGFAQADLLFDVYTAWFGQKRRIVNISSSQTTRWDTAYHNIRYRTNKVALEAACEFLWNKNPWPEVMLVAPTMTDTPMVEYRQSSAKVDPDLFAETVYRCLETKEFRVQVFKVTVNP
jgi:NAD(P)-dependent dehydrogenase (short-subunit alcohol dehydrogenase family)